MKKMGIIFTMMLMAGIAFSQSKPAKLSKEESAKMTQDQRFVHETNRKSNRDHKLSLKKKVRIQKKQARKTKHTHSPKHKAGNKVD